MKKIDKFINCYPLSKTLCFSLIPIGKTEETFTEKLLLEEDENRAEEYGVVKNLIDDYHRYYIETVLSKYRLDGVTEYAELYYKRNKTVAELDAMESMEASMRKAVSEALTSTSVYKDLFGNKMIKDILPEFLREQEDLASVKLFENFYTYFAGFNTNRKNMYSSEEQSTAISCRCINDNLPKFLDNAANFEKVLSAIPERIKQANGDFEEVFGITAEESFKLTAFSSVLSQTGIDRYNGIIGGYTCSDGTKVQGLNEYINLYNQQLSANDRSQRLPLMKSLYKQILTESDTVSFIAEQFQSDNQLISAVYDYYNKSVKDTVKILGKMFERLEQYDIQGIFLQNNSAVTDVSKALCGQWNAVEESWYGNYAANNPIKCKNDAEDNREAARKVFNKIKSFSLSDIQLMCKSDAAMSITDYFKSIIIKEKDSIFNAYTEAEVLLTSNYEATNDKKLCRNEAATELLKALLDSIKVLEHTVKGFLGSGKEESKDDIFYGEFLPLYNNIASVDKLYDKVRNYITRKPYSKDKIKLNFGNPQLLGGWDKNKERDYRTVLLKDEKFYYLALMDKSNNKSFLDPPYDDGEEYYDKIEYKLLPGPNKMLPKVFFAASNIEYFAPDEKILEIRKNETFKKGKNFNLSDCHALIDFYKTSIEKHEEWSQFGFEFTETKDYNDISEFYNEIKTQGYKIKYRKISRAYIDELTEKGQLYLFRIYNKDFSEHSHGNSNLHTMYFKMLFDERNLENVVYQLNGGAEMFYRKASIKEKEKTVHPANRPIKNKNPLNAKSESIFDYDITKDKRFTKRQFSLHIPITLNFKADGREFLNNDVRRAVKDSESNYIIGIDRGERNLLYICVINDKGEIVEQKSLNSIISDNGHKVDYHNLLNTREKERDAARKSWGTVQSIKELKEGYLSQVIHEITKLVVKYDALIAMENLNFGFKNGRFKVEKQVYQKFENMLISKLNYLVDKNTSPDEKGGLLNAYQLTNKVDGVNRGIQNGIILYVPAWLTSKIDPKTGFVNLLNTKYTSVSAAKAFAEKLDDIRYNTDSDYFEFDIDYSKFDRGSQSYRKKWTVCSNSDRIITYRNPEKNSSWDSKRVVPTEEFKKLFTRYSIDYTRNLKESILLQDSKEFFSEFMHCISAMLQMRNSITGSDVDYLISPVKASDGEFFDSRTAEPSLPIDADANGAYNIARKALWAVRTIKETSDDNLKNVNLSIKNAEWLKFAQQ